MKTDEGTKLVLSPVTAYTLRNILKEWIAERTPVSRYVGCRYSHMDEKFREFKEKSLTERLVRVHMVLEQLEEEK